MIKFLHIDDLGATDVPGIDAEGVHIKNALGVPDQAGFSADLVEFDPHQRSPATLHKGSAEMFYVIAGEAEFTIGDQTRRCGPGALIFFPANSVHIIETHEQAVRFLAIKSPAIEPGGDVHFVPDPAAP